jgi:hypothetical protein
MQFLKTFFGNHINPETGTQVIAFDAQEDGHWRPCVATASGTATMWGMINVGPYGTEAECQAVIQQLVGGIDASTLLT